MSIYIDMIVRWWADANGIERYFGFICLIVITIRFTYRENTLEWLMGREKAPRISYIIPLLLIPIIIYIAIYGAL